MQKIGIIYISVILHLFEFWVGIALPGSKNLVYNIFFFIVVSIFLNFITYRASQKCYPLLPL